MLVDIIWTGNIDDPDARGRPFASHHAITHVQQAVVARVLPESGTSLQILGFAVRADIGVKSDIRQNVRHRRS